MKKRLRNNRIGGAEMFIRRIISGVSLSTILFSAPPVLAKESSQITIASYSSSGMGFVGKGHCQWWAGSPLSNQNPHVWAGFFILFLLGSATLVWKFYRSRKELAAGSGQGGKLNMLAAELEIRKRRLVEKINELDRKFSSQEISSDGYDKLCARYKAELDKIEKKLKQIKELGEQQ
ncbi:MAG: hypothetical protein C4550_07030 [Nitrospiraceae bacterium]|nr:MAG: hypothetical protein C4550_07030 [Nitrospiraceae bacterium]